MKMKILAAVACAVVGMFIACGVWNTIHSPKRQMDRSKLLGIERLQEAGCIFAGIVAVGITYVFQKRRLHPTVAVNLAAAQITYCAVVVHGLKRLTHATDDIVGILRACKLLLMQFIS
jgi:hypothetical protein